MKIVHAVLCLLLATIAQPADAARRFSLQPSQASPGQAVSVRIDEDDGCYEFDQHTVRRNGHTVNVEILSSDLVTMPCLPQHVTPIFLALGTFDLGRYDVEVVVCGDPCGTPTVLTLDVGGIQRRATIPVFGWVALLLSCSGIFALAFGTSIGPRRR